MKFQKLRLAGFKSFCEATDFVIEPGLTGVVGPNGCGKFNLVEALCWVVGENPYKNMRAAGMEDVIFCRSGKRLPRKAGNDLRRVNERGMDGALDIQIGEFALFSLQTCLQIV